MAKVSIPVVRERHLKERAADEFKRFVVIVVYLWVVFALLSIHKSLVLSQHHLDFPEHAFAIINAFIFAKVLLIGEHFHLGTRFHHKPLIYPILHKCLIFTVVLISFHIVESILVGLWHGNTVASSLPLLGENSVKSIGSVGIMCFVVLLPFFGFREIGRVIGNKELSSLIMHKRSNDPWLSPSGRP
jgi:hypothetical protein